jgi:hypothetical protein
MQTWLDEAGLRLAKVQDLPQSKTSKGKSLTVSIWLAETQDLAFHRRLSAFAGALA